MIEIRDYINRVVNRTQITREVFEDNKLPTSFDKIKIVPFFGDIKSEFILATLLFNKLFPKDYVIVCSWPEHFGIYSNINEYWSVSDEDALSNLNRSVNKFQNSKSSVYEKLLLRYFDNVVDVHSEISKYYRDGFTAEYFRKYKDIDFVLPTVPSASIANNGDIFKFKKNSVYLATTKFIHRWNQGKEERVFIDDKFWKTLVSRLLKENITPIIPFGYAYHDLSGEFGQDCYYVSNRSVLAHLAVMRYSDCVLDVFNGTSRYAILARSPYLLCDERQRYFANFEYIIDDLCGKSIPKSFLFSFAPMVSGETPDFLSDAIVNRLVDFIPTINRNKLPSTVASEQVLAYDDIKIRGVKMLRPKHISVPISYDD